MPDERTSPSAGWREVYDEMAADTHCEPEEADDREDSKRVDRPLSAGGEDPGRIQRYVAEAAARLAVHWQNVSADDENEAEMEAEGD